MTDTTMEIDQNTEETAWNQELHQALSLFNFPEETIKKAVEFPNLQDALDWVFAEGDLGDFDPLKGVIIHPKGGSPQTEQATPAPKKEKKLLQSELEESALSRRIRDLVDQGLSEEEIAAQIKPNKKLAVPPPADPNAQAPTFDLANGGEAELAAYLASQGLKVVSTSASTGQTISDGQPPAEGAEPADGAAPTEGTGGAQDISPEDMAVINQLMAEDARGTAESRRDAAEMKEEARKLQERIRREIQEKERQDEREKERKRIEFGKEALKNKEIIEQQRLKQQREERMREKKKDKEALEKARAQLQADREARKKKS
ncbi:hypothetical protein BLNAU_15061 [Blattamonas nauphoetae]|uniref:Uncharacterized protein n=1 Tax=Blattamonas nauphoetae TaxID=2049346 RepID=A0ABQ9XDK6_9EUKA|nr:hypothetical protein BLNAU_15061 [Blattamonas nauphoetae]